MVWTGPATAEWLAGSVESLRDKKSGFDGGQRDERSGNRDEIGEFFSRKGRTVTNEFEHIGVRSRVPTQPPDFPESGVDGAVLKVNDLSTALGIGVDT